MERCVVRSSRRRKRSAHRRNGSRVVNGVMMKHWHLFLAFFRVGILGYGGGPSSIPLVQKEAVDRYRWLNDEEFGDILALGNTLPGPIATKMAGYIGYRVAGVFGAVTATLATVLPTVCLMVVLLTVFTSFKDLTWVAGATKGVTPVVGVMLAMLAFDFFNKARTGGLGLRNTVILLLASFVALTVLRVHPGALIAGLLLFAIVQPEKEK